MSSLTYKMIISPTGAVKFSEKKNYNWLQDVKIDKTNKTFSIGDYKYERGDEKLTRLQMASKISTANAQYQRINDYISSFTICDTFNVSLLNANIRDEVRDDMNALNCNFAQLFMRVGVCEMQSIFENIQQAYDDKDSLGDVRYLVYTSGLSVSDIRSSVGKGAWARLTKLNLNDLKAAFNAGEDICKHSDSLPLILDFIEKYGSEGSAKHLLMRSYKLSQPCRRALLLNALNEKIDVNDTYSITEAIITIRDCESILNRQGQKFNPKWSIKRITEEHDYWSSRQTYATMGVEPDDVFEIPKYFEDNAKKKSPNGLEYRFLHYAKDYLEEGKNMGHCIANYARKAKSGDYVTMNVKHKGKTATVGYANTSRGFIFEQMYSKHNNKEYTPQMEEFAKAVCKKPIISTPKILDNSKPKKKFNKDSLIFVGVTCWVVMVLFITILNAN